MALLLLLNGPPGIGKTTLARRWVRERPLACCLDVDDVRATLGQWEASPREAGLLARAMAVAMARVHLSAGHDVVVPQYVARPAFAEELEGVAGETGAAFREVVLMDSRERALARGRGRTGDAELGEMYERLAAYVTTRPDAVVAHTRAGDLDGGFAALAAAVAR